MDEYISREKAIETIQYRVCQGHGNKEHVCKRGSCAYCGIMEVMSDISSIEVAAVQPVRHGRWIWDSNAPHREHRAYKCSNCGCHSDFEENYCYNCGARMMKDGDAE